MSYYVAIAGKGGVGKTTLAGLLVTRLLARGCKPVLAVDADPNTCLDAVLGVKAETTIGSVREEAREIAGKGMASGLAKQDLLELKLAESLVEATGFDLLAMGRPEGPGCYCYANNVLKVAIGHLSDDYPYVVLDNEAGLENLSRRIVKTVDLLIMVADPSRRGLDTLARLHALACEMDIKFSKLVLIVNRLRHDELPEHFVQLREEIGATAAFGLPENEQLAEFAEEGKSLVDLPEDNPVSARLDAFLTEMGLPLNGK